MAGPPHRLTAAHGRITVPLMDDREDGSGKLRSFTGVGQSIGTWIAGLEQLILHRREPPAIVLQEHDRVEEASRAAGLTWTDEPVERPEPPDTTRARL